MGLALKLTFGESVDKATSSYKPRSVIVWLIDGTAPGCSLGANPSGYLGHVSDFTKQKIAFAVALLAVIFTLTPLLNSVGDTGFVLFGVAFKIRHLFYFIAAALGLSTYVYGIQFLTQRRLQLVNWAADVLYALAFGAPLVYAFLFLGVRLAAVVASILNSPGVITGVTLVTSLFSVYVGYLFALRTRGRLAQLERESTERRLQEQEIVQLSRAEALHKAGHYDLAVVEGFRAVEAAARRQGLISVRPPFQWIEDLKRRLPESVRPGVDLLRQTRNVAVHAIENVSEKQAREALAAASSILSHLADDAP